MTATRTEVVVVPGSGQVISLDGDINDLVTVAGEITAFMDQIRAAKQQLLDEVARRIDTTGGRSIQVDGVGKLETNPAVSEEYRPDEVTAALVPLLQDGLIGQEVLDAAVYVPAPRPPEPRVAKKVMGALAKHNDPRVRETVKSLAVETVQRRTVKVDGRAL